MIKSYLCWMDHSEIDITKNKYLSQINILINVELCYVFPDFRGTQFKEH